MENKYYKEGVMVVRKLVSNDVECIDLKCRGTKNNKQTEIPKFAKTVKYVGLFVWREEFFKTRWLMKA